jgi:hypothetical protein
VITAETTLILSQDYELFFHRSGTPEKCLFEPCDALLASARKNGYRITFYVDAGMLVRMQDSARQHKRLAIDFDRVRRHLRSIAGAGHDIGLHIHPHWEDTRIVNGRWAFDNTRYQLRQFSDREAADIVDRYARALGDASGMAPTSYRAGGFCIEPFEKIRSALLAAGIDVDSSVVPGAYLEDPDKGFDFRRVAAADWWTFTRSPSEAEQDGQFLEIPVTSQKLPFSYYWGRLAAKLAGRPEPQVFGNGSAKRIGKREILRRLAGLSRVAELSIDNPKVEGLERVSSELPVRRICHIMGHPKNISLNSLLLLEKVVRDRCIINFENVATAARRIRAGQLY